MLQYIISAFNEAREDELKMLKPLSIAWVFMALAWQSASSLAVEPSANERSFRTVEWTDLIPAQTLQILMNPPEYITQTEDGTAEDQISSQIKNTIAAANNDAYQQALVSTEVKAEMNGAKVRIPGFIVPLEFDDDQTITQFFLVPYFGACLHMPPPPPNQIILVDYAQGLQVDELYTPFWISGELTTAISENDMAVSAYSMSLMAYEPYVE